MDGASPSQPDAEGDGAGLDRDVERHLQLAPAERAFEHGGLDPMAQVLGSPVHELHESASEPAASPRTDAANRTA